MRNNTCECKCQECFDGIHCGNTKCGPRCEYCDGDYSICRGYHGGANDVAHYVMKEPVGSTTKFDIKLPKMGKNVTKYKILENPNESELNKLGQEGWKLVSVAGLSGFNSVLKAFLIKEEFDTK